MVVSIAQGRHFPPVCFSSSSFEGERRQEEEEVEEERRQEEDIQGTAAFVRDERRTIRREWGLQSPQPSSLTG